MAPVFSPSAMSLFPFIRTLPQTSVYAASGILSMAFVDESESHAFHIPPRLAALARDWHSASPPASPPRFPYLDVAATVVVVVVVVVLLGTVVVGITRGGDATVGGLAIVIGTSRRGFSTPTYNIVFSLDSPPIVTS